MRRACYLCDLAIHMVLVLKFDSVANHGIADYSAGLSCIFEAGMPQSVRFSP